MPVISQQQQCFPRVTRDDVTLDSLLCAEHFDIFASKELLLKFLLAKNCLGLINTV